MNLIRGKCLSSRTRSVVCLLVLLWPVSTPAQPGMPALVKVAEARLQFLEKELERLQRLAELNVTSANQYEQARSERGVAQGDLSVAQARQAQNDDLLSKTRIIAPFGGVVVERLMAKDPDDRYATPRDVSAALEALEKGTEDASRLASSANSSPRKRRRRR